MKQLLFLFSLLFCATVYAQEEKTPAFPGAEGFGRYTTGGRGGAVYHVTNLNDAGAGSFREACGKSGKRTIVFDVSGTIYLKSQLKLNRGDVTIAGQTAPGDGICIADYPFVIAADNVIIRYMRFRPGNRQVAYHEGDGLGGMDRKNIIVDHCSVSWSVDECLSVYGSTNITVQWCIAAQSMVNSGHSKGAHGYGGNWGGSGASYHHNLIAHHSSRTPRLGPRPGTQCDERMDLRNNVIYNWGGNGCYGGEGMNVNIVNNYYKPGPATPTGNKGKRIACVNIRTTDYCLDKDKTAKNFNTAMGTSYTKSNVSGSFSDGINYVSIGGKKYAIDMETNKIDVDGTPVTVAWQDWVRMLHKWGHFFVAGNVNTKYSDVTNDNWGIGFANQIDTGGNDGTATATTKDTIRLEEPIDFVWVTNHTAEKAYEKVLEYAGCSKVYDPYDKLILNDVKNGTAAAGTGSGNSQGFINSQADIKYLSDEDHDEYYFPTLKSEPALTDTDGDGMPDEWETANGLNPNDSADGKTVCSDGYTNLEHYLNSLVADITTAQNEGGTLEGIDVAAVEGVVAERQPLSPFTYNLQGQRVGTGYKGIIVKNGKKILYR